MGFYYSQLKKWFKLFNPNKFLILIYEEDIRINKIQTIKKICNHLEIDKSFTPENIDKKIHKTNSQLYLFLHYYQPFLTKAIFKLFPFVNNFSTSMIKISEEEKKCIYELYKSENDKLQELINRPLDIWSNSKP